MRAIRNVGTCCPIARTTGMVTLATATTAQSYTTTVGSTPVAREKPPLTCTSTSRGFGNEALS